MLVERHFEVECTLRPALHDAAALTAAKAGVVDALALDDELGELAAAHEVTKGRLFQALLEELRSAGVGHAQTDNSAKRGGAHDFRAEFGPARWHSLSLRADALRKLVRIKVADDNDLKTAREGFVLCKAFFDSLAELAALRGSAVSEFELLQDLSRTTA